MTMKALKGGNILERNRCCLIATKSEARGMDRNKIWTRSGGDPEGRGGMPVRGQICIALLLLVLLRGDLIFYPFSLLDDVVRVRVCFEDDGKEYILECWGGYGEGFDIKKIFLVFEDSEESRVSGEALILSHRKTVRSLPVISFILAES